MDLNWEKTITVSAKQGFFVGAMIGAVAWAIGSPLFGKLLGDYQRGDYF